MKQSRGVEITQDFIEAVTPANEILKSKVGEKNTFHAWSNANWYGLGTIELHMLPESKEFYEQHKNDYEEFFNVLKTKGFTDSEPTYDSAPVKGHGRMFSVKVLIKNQKVIYSR